MAATPLKQTLSTAGNDNATTVSPFDGVSGTGVEESAGDTANGNTFLNTGSEYLIVRNSDSAAHAFTVQGKPFTVPAGKVIHAGPFPVFQQFGTSPTITPSDTHLIFSVFKADVRGSSKR